MGKIMLNSIEYSGGGGNANVVHLTQAEYDALPSSKLTDDKIYMITDADSGGGSGVVDYSTTEQDTGVKWIDGKTIYQITIQINSPSTSLDDVPNISGIDTLIYVDGFLSSIYNSDKYIRHINYQEGNTIALIVFQKADKLKYKTEFGGETDRVAYITIQYTKTSSQGGN